MIFFSKKNLVSQLCRRSGKWDVVRRSGDMHAVYARDEAPAQNVRIRYSPGFFMLFEAELPVRFSLEHPPAGVFARVLTRSFSLKFASWRMDIRQSCEAVLYLSVQMPSHAMTAGLFDDICREMRDEVLAFHQELRDKFRYDAGVVMDVTGPPRRGIGTLGQEGHSGVPQCPPWNNLPGIRYLS